MDPPERSSAPGANEANTNSSSRFTAQASTAEDILKAQTVGLVQLSDFRKRRAEALEQKEREAQEHSLGRFTPGGSSGAAIPNSESLSQKPPTKKKKRPAAKGKLSFGVDDDDDSTAPPSKISTPRSETPDVVIEQPEGNGEVPKKRLGPNSAIAAPSVMTKSVVLKEKLAREQLRREFMVMQEAVKATEFLIPFVFYDGTNTPGGVCKIKKGDHVWLFLDRSRKVGAELGVGGGGGGEKSSARREWARVGVDDLMLVRGEVIIPHHYEFYYFITNKTAGPSGTPLFPYATKPPATAPSKGATHTESPLRVPREQPKGPSAMESVNLEGADEDPTFTKVVDRRWYKRNKHIFPASVWEEFEPAKDYSNSTRRDAQGNAFFFS